MSIVTDAIAEDLATLERVIPTPTAPFGYGSDLSCVNDLSDTAEEVDPFGQLGIAQAAVRRLTTQRGTLPDDPEYGHDVTQYLNRGMTPEDIRDGQSACRNELTKDDRIEDATVTFTLITLTVLRIGVALTPADPNLKPFTFTFAVTDGAVLLEALG
jgi:hypothetical protein